MQGTPFNIRLFLGATHSTSPSESYNYMHTPTQIGNVFNFASPPNLMGRDSSGCANCQRQELNHTRMAGQVILTDRLVELVKREIPRGGIVLQSLARQDVVPFLRHNLNWIVTDVRDFLSCLYCQHLSLSYSHTLLLSMLPIYVSILSFSCSATLSLLRHCLHPPLPASKQ